MRIAVAVSTTALTALATAAGAGATNTGTPKPQANPNNQTLVCHDYGYPGATANDKNGPSGTPGLDSQYCVE